MTKITASEVNNLRKISGAGIMDCKNTTLVQGYITYGNGQFDGQDSGHDFYGTLYTPPIGWRNNTDGGRSILFPDYRQA
jgi:hypothetical protein